MSSVRLAVDIGGTFTDFVLDVRGRWYSRKVLTTSHAPEEGVLAGIDMVLNDAGLKPVELDLIIHGTTLATNSIIERKGARTALIVTEGHRDAVEIAYENRFEQYDIFMDKPPPLVPRHLRLGVPERIDARGRIVSPLDETSIPAIVETLHAERVTSVAIGFLHSYVNAVHEQRVRQLLRQAVPELSITLSSEVCPEMREYERWSTACANAYVQPVMAGYLERLDQSLRARGFVAAVFLITSAGGLTTLETARRFPIRLVESGPAGGAILGTRIAAQCRYDKIVSFDMGGTTAKICLIDNGQPQYSRSFEVARQYRFLKGSGIPIRIPVIEMVEIGAGGGSIATVDEMARIHVGPESAGSDPGPACYGRGGKAATVTDADLELGRIRPERFAGGTIRLHPQLAGSAIAADVGKPLGLDRTRAALGLSEVVEENMANAARVHAVERGKELSGRAMVAFGGAAPLHAARLAEKLDIDTVIVPTSAGVGSAVGFLMAPVAYEVVRSRYVRLDTSFDPTQINAFRHEMRAEAEAVIRRGAPAAPLTELWTADMRYRGQGHDVTVTIPARDAVPADRVEFARLFEAQYSVQFGRSIPGLEVEVLSWSLRLATAGPPVDPCPPSPPDRIADPAGRADVVDSASGERESVPVYVRSSLMPGCALPGPALIIEDETTTLVLRNFTARINGLGYIVMARGEQ
ncbi:MAG TPA: hydantoinase/oxoprolinase family protein [Candidatus Cybelea sp.]|nr:hydantoinase/oxoprolinase family protein [Candidatus Cybelea sp.]